MTKFLLWLPESLLLVAFTLLALVNACSSQRVCILQQQKFDVKMGIPVREGTLIKVKLTVSQKKCSIFLCENHIHFLHGNNEKTLDGDNRKMDKNEKEACTN